VFQLTTNGDLTTLVSFTDDNGANPFGGVVADAVGNLYGTTLNGGGSGLGTIFRLATNGVLTTLHSFGGGLDFWYNFQSGAWIKRDDFSLATRAADLDGEVGGASHAPHRMGNLAGTGVSTSISDQSNASQPGCYGGGNQRAARPHPCAGYNYA
jgi:uncharacterized repeat protein (TIGR03803 family)